MQIYHLIENFRQPGLAAIPMFTMASVLAVPAMLEYRKHKRPVCPSPAAAYPQQSATSPSDHPECALNTAYLV